MKKFRYGIVLYFFFSSKDKKIKTPQNLWRLDERIVVMRKLEAYSSKNVTPSSLALSNTALHRNEYNEKKGLRTNSIVSMY